MNNHKILFSFYKKYDKKGGWQNSRGIEIPTIREDMVLIKSPDQTSGLISDEIVVKVNDYYERYNKKLSIKGTQNASYIFNIKNIQKDIRKDPVWNQGQSNAVYLIDDINHIVDDNSELLLKLFPQNTLEDSNHNITILEQLMDQPKIKKEYENYYEYLPRIYFYGILYQYNERYVPASYLSTFQSYIYRTTPEPQYLPIPIEANQTKTNYIITKKYNSLPYSSLEFNKRYNLSNLQKLKFLISNINMLNALYRNNSFHVDYKPENVGWENNITMNVILLDYEKDTIIDTRNNSYFIKSKSNNIIKPNPDTFLSTPEYEPKYISDYGGWTAIRNSDYDKWSIGGLAALIIYLNIQYNTSSIITFPPTISNLTLDPNITTDVDAKARNFLHLYSDKYDQVPSYDELGRIFKYILDNKLYSG